LATINGGDVMTSGGKLAQLSSIEDRGQTDRALLRYHAHTRVTLTFHLDL